MIEIHTMRVKDAQTVIEMMKVFYASPAVHTNGSTEIFEQNVNRCLQDEPYLEGYVMKEDGQIVGYAMAAKSFATEFGKPCIWLEDLYLKPEARSRGLAHRYFNFMKQKYPDTVFRLEASSGNTKAIDLYRRLGFSEMTYTEMKYETRERK
ncbi:GNAT family N-acetyltransferase [Catenisphaera adipataccumulans]|uniref:Ribosomal protein S18 acetylase RimI-like enzyme n=1 Tax=Catenisphaera adipataccumulans TaxID=700500 RepID=A0A7W8FV35_9FIRM|nr:GNAT family N-acetyltransferase [Catenisphaera adipataccumulans]MBB5182738.1 ribosomal protein S18 acetylase RimI-like enzyme [Catenisphaera adipataccumulans]